MLFLTLVLIYSVDIINLVYHLTGVARRGVSVICKWPWICYIIWYCWIYHVRIHEAKADGTILYFPLEKISSVESSQQKGPPCVILLQTKRPSMHYFFYSSRKCHL